MVENRDSTIGSKEEILPQIISDYKKHSLTCRGFVRGVIINSGNHDSFEYNLFLLASDISKLIMYASYSDSARALMQDVNDTVKTLNDWYSSLNGLSASYVTVVFQYFSAMSDSFVKLCREEKVLDETGSMSLSLSVTAGISPTQELKEPDIPLQNLGIASDPQIVYLPDYHQIIQEPSERTDPHVKHPFYTKYQNLHPLDLALINVLKRKGYATEDLSKEDLNKVLQQGMGFHLSDSEESVKVVPEIEAARILKDIYTKQGLSKSDNKDERKANAIATLELAATLLSQQARDKTKE